MINRTHNHSSKIVGSIMIGPRSSCFKWLQKFQINSRVIASGTNLLSRSFNLCVIFIVEICISEIQCSIEISHQDLQGCKLTVIKRSVIAVY